MSTTCQTCDQEITKTTGKTELSCGHTFHPRCIHSYYRGASSCPRCPQGKGPLLDFGDNIEIANATREYVYATSAVPQAKGLGWITDKFKSKNPYPLLCGADELVTWKAPISAFLEKGMTAKNVVESGIKFDTWFQNGYKLEDLQKLKVTWEDFVYMGFGSNMLKTIPVPFLVDVLKIDISHLIGIGITISQLSQSGYTANDFLALKCTTHSMINMGLTPEQMQKFQLTNAEWNKLAI